jgi:DNA-binding transcriptional ArsR family regulator
MAGGETGPDEEAGDNGHRREELISALNHPKRRRILRLMLDRKQRLSATEIATELEMVLGDASYHLGSLRDLSAVKRAGTRQVRGALQRFYEVAIEDDPPIETLLEETREADEAYAEKAKPKPRKAKKKDRKGGKDAKKPGKRGKRK